MIIEDNSGVHTARYTIRDITHEEFLTLYRALMVSAKNDSQTKDLVVMGIERRIALEEMELTMDKNQKVIEAFRGFVVEREEERRRNRRNNEMPPSA